MSTPCELDITTARGLLHSGELSAAELMASVLERLDATEPVVHAYATVLADAAQAAALAADQARAAGTGLGPLHGIPVAVKDLFRTAGIPTEAGSRALEGNVPANDAAAVTKLRNAGAILVGKTVTHEFAYGLNVPPTRNAWDPGRYPGGSSAGSGVAVAVRSALASLGADTGGSGRVPAAVNGLVALKPTYGVISREGVISMSATLDAVVPITRTAADCAVVFEAIAESHRRDRPAGRQDAPRPAPVIPGIRIGVDPLIHFGTGVDSDVKSCAEQALTLFGEAGATTVPIGLPEAELGVPVTVLLVMVDTSNYHRTLLRTAGDRYDQKTRVMLEAGELIPGSAYVEAQRQRSVLRHRVRQVFESNQLDVIAAPTHPVPAVPMEYLTNPLTSEPDQGFSRALVHTGLANLTGLPAVTLPCGFTRDGLPVGLQFMGRPYSEPALLSLAEEFQEMTDWHTRRPHWLPAAGTPAAEETHS